MAATRRTNQRATPTYRATVVDQDGTAIPAATLTGLTLTVFDIATGQHLNSRIAQDALNTNGVTVSSAGALSWTMSPADNEIVDDTLEIEAHRAVFTWTWGSGNQGQHVIPIEVTNLRQPGTIQVVRGDDYKSADGRAFLFPSYKWPNLTGATVTFTATRGVDFPITVTATAPTAGTGLQVVQVELPANKTSLLAVASKQRPYYFDIQATLASSSNVVTLIRQRPMVVVEDMT